MIRTAKFTIVQHEPVFFPIWLKYYLKFFEPKDIWVLHHLLPTPRNPEEAAVKIKWEQWFNDQQASIGFNVTPIDREFSFDHEWLRITVCQYQRALLEQYEAVLFTEVDEIVAPDPRSVYGADLGAYIQANMARKQVCVCNGYEVVQKLDEEPPLDLNRPLLAQREWWYWNKMYSKPLLSRIPLNWCWGFHASTEIPVPYRFKDDNLYLIHLHKLDYDICSDRHISNASRRWADGVFGFQNRIVHNDRLKKWWYNHIDMNCQDAVLEAMPSSAQAIL